MKTKKHHSLIAGSTFALVMGGCLAGGCHTSTNGAGEFKITYGTSLTFNTTAQKVDGETAEAGVDANPWIVDLFTWWIKDRSNDAEKIATP